MGLTRNEEDFPHFNGSWLKKLAESEIIRRAQQTPKYDASSFTNAMGAISGPTYMNGADGWEFYDISNAFMALGYNSSTQPDTQVQEDIANHIINEKYGGKARAKIVTLNSGYSLAVAPLMNGYGLEWIGAFTLAPSQNNEDEFNVFRKNDGQQVKASEFLNFWNKQNINEFGFSSTPRGRETVSNDKYNIETTVSGQDFSIYERNMPNILEPKYFSTRKDGKIYLDLNSISKDHNIPIDAFKRSYSSGNLPQIILDSYNRMSDSASATLAEGSFVFDEKNNFISFLLSRTFPNGALFIGDYNTLNPEKVNENTKFISFTDSKEADAFSYLNPEWKRRGDSNDFTPPTNQDNKVGQAKYILEKVRNYVPIIEEPLNTLKNNINNFTSRSTRAQGRITNEELKNISSYISNSKKIINEIIAENNNFISSLSHKVAENKKLIKISSFKTRFKDTLDNVTDKLFGEDKSSELLKNDYSNFLIQLNKDIIKSMLLIEKSQDELFKLQQIPGMTEDISRKITQQNSRYENLKRNLKTLENTFKLNSSSQVEEVNNQIKQQEQIQAREDQQQPSRSQAPQLSQPPNQSVRELQNSFLQELNVIKQNSMSLSQFINSIPQGQRGNAENWINAIIQGVDKINILNSQALNMQAGSEGKMIKISSYNKEILADQLSMLVEKVSEKNSESGNKIKDAIENMINVIASNTSNQDNNFYNIEEL